MPKKYRLVYKTPQGKCYAEADNVAELESMVSERIARMLTARNRLGNMTLSGAAKEVMKLYENCHKRRGKRYSQSRIDKAGLGLDFIKCYLQGMTIAKIAEWLKCNRSMTVSKSAVGRYRANLLRLRIYPIAKLSTHKFQTEERSK